MTFWIAFKVWLWNRRRVKAIVRPAPEKVLVGRGAFCISCGGFGCHACSHGARSG